MAVRPSPAASSRCSANVAANAKENPPECDGAQECKGERDDSAGVQFFAGRGRAGDDDRFAEGKNDEEMETLGEVSGRDVPDDVFEALPTRKPYTTAGAM